MKLIRNASAVIGAVLFFGAAGTDQMYAEMGKMPPETHIGVAVAFIAVSVATAALIKLRERRCLGGANKSANKKQG